VSEPGQSVDQQIAALHAQADQAMQGLQKTIEGVRAAQQEALRATGEATSKDGTVRVAVDATGVLTSVTFAPSVFDRSTPEKLAQTVLATAQSAAAQARGRMSEAMNGVRGNDDVQKAAAEGATRLGVPPMAVPQVPRTAVDPTGQDNWTAPEPAPTTGPAPTPAPVPAPQPMRSTAPRRAAMDDDGEDPEWLFNQRAR
jgi:DNA-binding protein YbaB